MNPQPTDYKSVALPIELSQQPFFSRPEGRSACLTKNFSLGNENKKEVTEGLPKMTSMIDKLARINVIHKNKAANLKSEASRHVLNLK